MGLLRLFLAYAVVIGHYVVLYPHSDLARLLPYLTGAGWNGAIKVNSFFVVAGFYTQLLLEEKFLRLHYQAVKFCLYRTLRLYPVYLLVLLLTALISYYADMAGVSTGWIIPWDVMLYRTNWWHNIFLFIPEIFKTTDFNEFEVIKHLLIGPAWTLSIEFVFIAIAPFFLLRASTYWALVAASVVAAVEFYFQEVVRNYMIVSTVYFMCGTLGYKWYRLYLKEVALNLQKRLWAYLMVGAIVLGIIFFGKLRLLLGRDEAYVGFMAMVVVFIPYIAAYTRRLPLDRAIGELAYAVYLSQFLFIMLAEYIVKYHKINMDIEIIFGGTFVFAMACYMWIDTPVTAFRKRMFLE